MKKIITSFFVIVFVAVLSFNLHISANETDAKPNLQLENIEALASGEDGGSVTVVCMMNGSVKCPMSGARVYYVAGI